MFRNAFRNKKGDISTAIRALVVIILAMTFLGLGIMFVRNIFSDIGDTTSQIQEQMRQQILDDLRTGNKKLSFPSNKVTVGGGEEVVLAFGVKNLGGTDLNFRIKIEDITNVTTEATSGKDIVSSNDLQAAKGENAFFWDTTSQTVSSNQAEVYGVTLATDTGSKGDTFLYKVKVMSGTDFTKEYASKTFFVKVI